MSLPNSRQQERLRTMAAPDQRRGRGPRHQREEHKAAIDSAEEVEERPGRVRVRDELSTKRPEGPYII